MTEDSFSQHRNDLIGRFAQHKVAANLLMLLMMIAGAIGLSRLNTQFLPTFALDYVTVRILWPGASAEDVAQSITTPIEQELKGLDYVKKMTSTSSKGVALIALEYEEGSDMSFAIEQVKDRIAVVRNLPAESEAPQITKVTRYEDVATLIITSSESLRALRPMAYRFEQQLLDRGIAKVEFVGLPEEELAIQVPSAYIHSLGQSLPQIGQWVNAQSQDIPAGSAGRKEGERELRSLEKKRSEDAFRQMAIVTTRDGKRLQLGDIATLERRAKDRSVEVFYEGKPAVLMRLKRTESADTLKNAAIFNAWLDETRPLLPPSVEVHAFSEAYILIEERIDLLLKNGLSGLVLVVAILFIFLNGRVAFWVAWGIPVSFLGTLAVLYMVGGSINMVSLFALIMALGIIVDDAIVVGEDALTHYQTGEASLMAAEGGARRMLVPVMSSSLTTIAAFLPLLMVGGIMGNILSAIPIVIICVIIASLIESFLVLPGHLRHSFHRSHQRAPSALRQRLDNGFNHFRDQRFRPLVEAALRNRSITLLSVFCGLVLAVALVATGRVPFTFFPTPDNTFINASVKFAAGTPIEKIKDFAFTMEARLRQVDGDLIKRSGGSESALRHVVVRLNTGSFDGGVNYQTGNQYATVQAELTSPDHRTLRNAELIEAWQAALPSIDGLEQISITSPRGGPPGSDIDIALSNVPPEQLKAAAQELITALQAFQGVSNIQDDLPYGQQQYIFKLSPGGEALGLTIGSVGQQVRAAFDGQLLQLYNEGQDEIEVRIMLPDAERDQHGSLQTFPIVTPDGSVVPLENVIQMESRRGLELLRHTAGKLGIHVTADVNSAQTNANRVTAELTKTVLPHLAQTYGLNYRLEGKAEEQRETGQDMALGALIGITLIYLTLAWVFASYFWPLAVMSAIPFGLTGAILGHWMLGLDLTILSLFGFFGLSGIVVNDAIILVTFYQELRREGYGRREALTEAACQRLRAVILTSLTTIAGLLPLLFETSLQAQFLIPMAVSISFGLALSTVLVLFVIPIILSLIEDLTEKLSPAPSHSLPQEAPDV
ncbi:MAG: efflux RND transporter permease subunit [Hahellaceae bacterium]|nr:efflux RND transporter permease subunit [Hahellaceae bacterium]